MLCFGFLVMLCQAPAAPAPIDSYCTSYRRVIVEAGDAASLARARLTIRRRVAGNDLLYRCRCERWQSPLCAGIAR